MGPHQGRTAGEENLPDLLPTLRKTHTRKGRREIGGPMAAVDAVTAGRHQLELQLVCLGYVDTNQLT